jgi:Protein of unknown function (DUF4058)
MRRSDTKRTMTPELNDMNYPFPGMDPYLEHPALWESVHARLIVAIANQLQPKIDPRYITSIEERVFIEGPQRRIPDVWIQRVAEELEMTPLAEGESDTAVVVEVENLEIHERRVEILDSYNGMRLVSLIEVVSPTNKAAGPGRESYKTKQKETLARECHLVEIDLLRQGRHVVAVPEWRVKPLKPFDSLCCVNRWPARNRFELYPRTLRQRLPRVRIPLAPDDPDAILDVQAALEQVYNEGRYARRIRYDEKCQPRLSTKAQAWADERLAAFRAARADPATG